MKKSFITLHNETDNTRNYLINEENLRWLLKCSKAILERDLEFFKNQPMESAVKYNLEIITDCLDVLDQE